MNEHDRTRDEILRELQSLRRRVAELEADVAVAGGVSDTGRRKGVDEIQHEERDRAQRYLDVAGVMIVAVRPDQTVSLINQKGCEILGYSSEDEVLGKNWFQHFLPPRLVRQVRSVFDRIVRGELSPVEYYENPVVTSSGEEPR